MVNFPPQNSPLPKAGEKPKCNWDPGSNADIISHHCIIGTVDIIFVNRTSAGDKPWERCSPLRDRRGGRVIKRSKGADGVVIWDGPPRLRFLRRYFFEAQPLSLYEEGTTGFPIS